ncbi:MAG: ATP-binding protein [Gemmatimonadales bacterium]
MSLRTKLIALFAVLGVVPIIGLGIFAYMRSVRAVEDLVAARTLEIAQRVAQEIRDRYALRLSDLLLLAENAETQRFYREHETSAPRQVAEARRAADAYLRRAWEALGASYRWVEFRDSVGVLVYRLGAPRDEPLLLGEALSGLGLGETVVATQPIREVESGRERGSLLAAIRLRTLLPDDALAAGFGRDGYSVVVDRSTWQVLYHPRRSYLRQPVSVLMGPDGWPVDDAMLVDATGHFGFEQNGVRRVASFASLAVPQWTVVASASVDEFAPPFARTRLINLALVIAVAAVITVAFLLTTRRVTRSLGALTAAADQVAEGDFTPDLPPAGEDEVGKLSAAFALMVYQIRDMLRRIQESRQMAAIGQFASQLSHEIRNPLTSIKLNLQRLDRGVSNERIPREYAGPIGICLREVQRLDRVAAGVLSAARSRPPEKGPLSIHRIVRETLEVLRPQMEERAIIVRSDLSASTDMVLGDAEQLKGVFLNLLLNAVDAMPDGGWLEVASETVDGDKNARSVIRLRVSDTGPGVPAELKERVFEPFVSTKDDGTGFGLTLAQHAVEQHGGVLRLDDADATAGAVFVVELPLAPSEETA